MSSTIALQELFKAGFDDFVVPSYETAPFTTIQNRAQVTRSLKAIAGVERVHVKGINLLQNEFGPNGERVWEPENKDTRIRFVGGWLSKNDPSGSRVETNTLNDYIEITFYGTGLNILTGFNAVALDHRVVIDGGVESGNYNTISASASIVLNSRNYGTNQVITVVSGLSLGLHTAKIRLVSGTYLNTYGFEILNQRIDLAVYAGAGISNGSFNGLSALAISAFNQDVTGTRGARVVKYIENGTLKSAVQEVDATAKYLALSDHTNEEIVRRINFREFGANRADDFSTLAGSGSSRVFTLDDGTTTLVGSNVFVGSFYGIEGVAFLNPSFLSITFVGTGLDIFGGIGPTAGSMPLTIDGVSAGSLSLPATQTVGTIRICSGLPYGTHTIKLSYTSGSVAFFDFIIYQPKKPSIPAGALEIADYNLMADFSATAIVSADAISTGVLSKSQAREMTYVGTWTAALNVSVKNGITVSSSTVGNYVEYTFWGTGFSIAANVGTSGTATLAVDGSNYSGATVTAGSIAGAVWTMATTNGGRLRVSGLSLGLHKVRLTITTNVGSLFIHGIDVIAPIHQQDSSLKVGSASLKSITKYSPEKSVSNAGPDLSKAKAWVKYDSSTSIIQNSNNISGVLRLGTGIIRIFFEKPFKNNNYIAISVGSLYDYSVTVSNTGVLNQKSNYVDMENFNSDTNSWNDTAFFAVFFGELIDEI